MSKDRRISDKTKSLLLVLVVAIALVVGLALTSSCTPRIIEHWNTQHDTTYVEKERVDSIFQKDSIFIREKGDSTYIYKELIRYKYRYIHDTTYRVKTDTLTIETIKEVEKPLTWAQQTKMGAFWWLVAGLAGCLLWIFRKPLIGLIKK